MSSISKVSLSVLFLLVASRAAAQVELAHDVAPATEAAAPADAAPVETTLPIGESDTVIYVGDLHCKTCAKKISRRLYTVKGVLKVRTDVAADVAIVTPQAKKSLDVKSLWAAAKKAGFSPTKLVGPTGTFEADAETKEPRAVTEQVASKPE